MTTFTKLFIQTQVKRKPDVDVDHDVTLFCADQDESNKSQITHPSNIRGYVFHGDKLLLQGFPYPTELNDETIATLEPAFSKLRFFESHEGTIIRVFNVTGKWFISTNRKLDAMKSKWAAKHTTFGQSFAEAVRDIVDDVEEDEDGPSDLAFEERVNQRNQREHDYLSQLFNANLNPENKYMFLLKPSQEERVVCRAEPRPTIYHVGTFDKDNNLTLDDTVKLGEEIVMKPKEHRFESIAALKNALLSLNIDHHQGFLAINTENNRHFKIVHPEYEFLFSVRGSVPSLRFRYLQLRKFGAGSNKNAQVNQQMLNAFLELYSFDADANAIEEEIYHLSKDLHAKYIKLYVDKKKQPLMEQENDVLQNIIHKAYIDTRIKTTVSRINDLLTNWKPSVLNRLLVNLKKRDKETRSEC